MMDVSSAISKRRALRSFDDFEITDELIEKLAGAAKLAPSCFNKQPWNFVFIREKDNLDAFPPMRQFLLRECCLYPDIVKASLSKREYPQ